MLKTEIFWTDLQQANERLLGTVILYDGLPFFVTECFQGDDGKLRVRMQQCKKDSPPVIKLMNSAKFNRFRALPQLGWLNGEKGVYFMARAARRSRQHGLSDQNVTTYVLRNEGPDPFPRQPLSSFMNTSAFENMTLNKYPSLESVLRNIVEGTGIAYSRKYCVYRDELGIRWLYRKLEKIGLFTGTDTLNLVGKFSFYKEEIMEDPFFTLNKIQEF